MTIIIAFPTCLVQRYGVAVPRQLFACAHSAYNRYAIHKRYANRPRISTSQLQHVITPPKMALSYSEKDAGIQEAIGTWQGNPGRFRAVSCRGRCSC
jgi:hypothetical protein